MVLAADLDPAFEPMGAPPIAAAASPRSSVRGSVSELFRGSAALTSSTAGRSSYSTTARRAARRAWSRVGGDREQRLPGVLDDRGREQGSSWRWVGLTSLTPGMSAAVSTRTTPGAARTASIQPRSAHALALMPR